MFLAPHKTQPKLKKKNKTKSNNKKKNQQIVQLGIIPNTIFFYR